MNRLPLHVIDLTSRLGLYAKEQLGAIGPSTDGCWIGIRSASLPDGNIVNWQQYDSDKQLLEPHADTVGVTVLVGPGAMSRLPKVTDWLSTLQLPIWYLIAPSAIVEAGHLCKLFKSNPLQVVYSLPNSDPKTLWFVLMELFVKAGEKALKEAGHLNGYIGENVVMINIKQAMEQSMAIDGALASALVDYRSGMCLAQGGNALNLELAAAGNTQVVKAKLKTVELLGLKKGIEDILITLVDQYHLIRLAPNHPGLFLYLVLDKEKSNLALARYKLTDIERAMQV